jgi:hypothetical protein
VRPVPRWPSPRCRREGGRLRRPPAGPALKGSVEEVVTSLTDRRIDRPLLPVSCPVCGYVVLRADGVSRQGCDLRWSGVRQPVPVPPPGRNRCDPSAATSTVMSVGRCAGGHRPVHWPLCGQPVSATHAAAPVGVRTRAAQRPSATAALRPRCPPWCPAVGRVDRWADTDEDGSGRSDVRCGRCPPAVATSPSGSDGGGSCGGHAWTVPLLPSGWLSGVPDTCRQPAAARHGRRPGVTATGTGRRGGDRWWDVANAGRRGRAGRSGGRGAGRGHRSSPAG